MLVQLIHGFDICIGFADTCFHFNGQVKAVFTTFEFFRRRDLVVALYFLQALQNPPVIQFGNQPVVAPAGKIDVFIQAHLVEAAASVHHIGRRQIRLTRKYIHNSFCGVGLEFLIFELNPHVNTS